MASKRTAFDATRRILRYARRFARQGRIGLPRLARAAAELLYPPTCVPCGADLEEACAGIGICSSCAEGLTGPNPPRCRQCALPLSECRPVDERCGGCLAQPPIFERTWTLGDYRGSLRVAVLRTKRADAEPLRSALAALFAMRHGDAIRGCGFEGVVPVPMHWRRRLWRGGNGVDSLARHLGRQLGLPVLDSVLTRRRHTVPQTHLPRKRRLRNVRGAFCVERDGILTGAHLLLVDDVMTTGTTILECTRALFKAGAARVAVAAFARARPDE